MTLYMLDVERSSTTRELLSVRRPPTSIPFSRLFLAFLQASLYYVTQSLRSAPSTLSPGRNGGNGGYHDGPDVDCC